MSPYERGWLVGLLEGEGTFHLSTDARGYVRSRVGVVMTDEDTVRAAHRIAGVGRVFGPYKPSVRHKYVWAWYVSARDEVKQALEIVHGHMSVRREAQIERMLDWLT